MDTSAEILDRLWARWMDEVELPLDVNGRPYRPLWQIRYQNTQRRGDRALRFETWLESHGGRVVQKNKVRYIEVWDQDLFMMLMLRYA